MIERFFVGRIVFSVKGIEMEGFLTDPDPLEADVKRAMIERARSVILVAQAQKFDERGLNVIPPPSSTWPICRTRRAPACAFCARRAPRSTRSDRGRQMRRSRVSATAIRAAACPHTPCTPPPG